MNLNDYIYILTDKTILIKKSDFKKEIHNICNTYVIEWLNVLEKVNNSKYLSNKNKYKYTLIINKYIRFINVYIYYTIKFFTKSKTHSYNFRLATLNLTFKNNKLNFYNYGDGYVIYFCDAKVVYDAYIKAYNLIGSADMEFSLSLLKNVIRIYDVCNSNNVNVRSVVPYVKRG
jgi:hypothetical protein